MNVYIPPEIAGYENELRAFFELMARKLALNRHKGFADSQDLATFYSAIFGELQETHSALAKGSQFELTMECVDVANSAWLLSLCALRMTRPQFEQIRGELYDGL